MKRYAIIPAMLVVLFAGSTALAQHDGDIEFGYANGKIEIEFGPEGFVFEGEFPTSGLFQQNTDDPGFESEDGSLTPGDIIDYLVLGPLMYHNGTSFAPVPTGVAIVISDNPSGSLIVDANTVGPVSGPGAIAQADSSGEVHAHIDFTLTPSGLGAAEFGAYGFLMQLTTTNPNIASSDPFYMVFNFGLSHHDFHEAVEDFAAIIPEPSSMLLCGMGLTFVLARRRRRSTVVSC